MVLGDCQFLSYVTFELGLSYPKLDIYALYQAFFFYEYTKLYN